MKKVFLVLMAFILAITCTAALAEEAPAAQEAPDPDNYSGVWQCDRASIEINWEEEGYRVLVEWGSSAWESTFWEYSCFYHEEDNTLVSMPFGLRTEVVYTEGSDEATYTDVYDDGQATFSLDEDGCLIWQDEKEDAGKGMRFVRIDETDAPDPDNYSGIWQCDRASIEIDWEEEGYRVFIEWSSSALEHTEWQYSCFYHEEDNTLVSMPFGLKTDVVYTEGSDEPAYTDIYDDGQATFSLDEDGRLIWQDEKEDAGKDMHFERVGD